MMAGRTVIGTVHYTVYLGSHSFAQCTTVNVRFLFTIFKEGAGSGSFWVTDMFCKKKKNVVHCTVMFC